MILFASTFANAEGFAKPIAIRPGIYRNAKHAIIVNRLSHFKDIPGWFSFRIDTMVTLYLHEVTGVAGLMVDPQPTFRNVLDRPFDLIALDDTNGVTHIKYRQGGTMQPIDLKVDIILNSSTGDLVRIDYDMKVARISLPPWILGGLHSGPLKKSDAFDVYHCDGLLRSVTGTGNHNEWLYPKSYDGALPANDVE